MTLEQQCAPARATIASIPDDYTDASPAHLIDACVRGDAAAWREFIRRYRRIIALTVYRVAQRYGESSPHEIEDLVQDTYLKLCADDARVLRGLRLKHPNAVFAFLKVVAKNVAEDHFKKKYNPKHGGGLLVPLEEAPEPVGPGPPALTPDERALLITQLEACLLLLLPPETRDRDLLIFRLYFRVGLTAKRIACLPLGLSEKGVEAVLHRLVKFLRNRFGQGASNDG
jgi:RNA polymerase sigma-70 factor, ECF subfamily